MMEMAAGVSNIAQFGSFKILPSRSSGQDFNRAVTDLQGKFENNPD